ncbi:MAG: hypothetical protein WHX60_08565 [Armatimonadota bacterium]
MSWIGRWIGNWAGKWFGSGQQQPTPATTARRFGRILKQADILFADSQFPSLVSSGAVILARQSSDDYVRFRIPDTACPPLPEPGTPLDSGVSDEAEPARWSYSGNPNTSNSWQMLESTDSIWLNYSVYSGDFMLEVESSCVSKTGTNTGDPGYLTFDGVCLVFDIGSKTYGIGVGWSKHHGVTEVPWGGSEGRAIRWFVAQGTSKVGVGEYMIPTSQSNVRYRVERSGSNIRFGWLNSSGQWSYSNWLSAGTGEIQVKFEGVRITDGGPNV